MIIGLVGLIGSGKGAISDFLIKEHNFEQVSFAGTLKDAVAAIFSWPRHLLEGDTAESREWREQVDEWWAKRLDMPGLTPRIVLQQFGTEVLRTHFHQDIWVASLEKKISDASKNYVISDARFKNELDIIHANGGKVWQVLRNTPVWYDEVELLPADEIMRVMAKYYPDIHKSEYCWLGHNAIDAVIENKGTLEDLGRAVQLRLGSSGKCS